MMHMEGIETAEGILFLFVLCILNFRYFLSCMYFLNVFSVLYDLTKRGLIKFRSVIIPIRV